MKVGRIVLGNCAVNCVPDIAGLEYGLPSSKKPQRPFYKTPASAPVSLPAESLSAEIERLLTFTPEYVADSSRNFARLYVRDLQAALKSALAIESERHANDRR